MPHESAILPPGYSVTVWSPAATKAWPSGAAGGNVRARFAFRWLLDRAHLFASREVGAVCIYRAGRLVHYSGFTPRYWRFPFLSERDLQIGDTWTHPEHRGKRLASFALQQIVTMKREQGRTFWYVVGNDNRASIRVVERLQFGLAGAGRWRKPLGIKLLGSYVPDDDGESWRATVKQTL
jgi:RimJ/RimL family protein N-acetyltransferase